MILSSWNFVICFSKVVSRSVKFERGLIKVLFLIEEAKLNPGFDLVSVDRTGYISGH